MPVLVDRGTFRRAAVLASAALVPLASTSCTLDEEPTLSRLGTVVVEWTIGGRHDDEACAALQADAAHVEALHEDGSLEEELTVACTAFAVRIPLRQDHYTAALTLLRGGEHDRGPVTRRMTVPFVVRAGLESRVVFEVAPPPLD